MNSYEAALAYIKECTKFGRKLGLERIGALLEYLGNPQHQFQAIHIAGTNGKGSTSAMLDSVLQQAGYKTGRYNSPHLVSYRERFLINGQLISKARLAEIMEKLRPAIEQVVAAGLGQPTEFEVGTALAFQYFALEGVDWAIIEVGMGGRFDATNVLLPKLSIIAHIALDHQEYLGDNLEKIAFEKAGIIKEGVPVVIGLQDAGIEDYLQKLAEQRSAPVFLASEYQVEQAVLSEGGTSCTVTGPGWGTLELNLPLHGKHQIKNALNVIAAMAVLNQQGFAISKAQLVAGLQQVTWPARFERVTTVAPLKLYLDGGHNPDGVRALVDTVQTIYPGKKVDLLVGLWTNRPLDELITNFALIARRVIVTTIPDPKSRTTEEVAAKFRALKIETIEQPDPVRALELLLQTDNEIAIVAGSLYLTGLLRGILYNLGD